MPFSLCHDFLKEQGLKIVISAGHLSIFAVKNVKMSAVFKHVSARLHI